MLNGDGLQQGGTIFLDFDFSTSLHQLVEGEGITRYDLIRKHARVVLSQRVECIALGTMEKQVLFQSCEPLRDSAIL